MVHRDLQAASRRASSARSSRARARPCGGRRATRARRRATTTARRRAAGSAAPDDDRGDEVAAISATKLDCENDGRSPAHVITIVSDRGDRPERVAAAEQHDDEAREDRDDEEPPVDRRVVEDGVDAVEPAARRVGVVDAHLRVPEDVARLVLDDPDHGEHERHHRELDVERRAPRRATRAARARRRAARTAGRRRAARSRPGARPSTRGSTRPPTRRTARAATRAARARASAAVAEQLPGERERRDGDDAVERQQQVRLRRADVHRDARGHAGERRDREQPGHAQEDPRAAGRGDRADDRRGREQAVVPVRREVDASPAQPSAHAARPATRTSRRGATISSASPSAADRAGGLGGAAAHRDHHGAARGVLPAVTYRR